MTQELTHTTSLTPVDRFDLDDDDSGGGAAFAKFDGATASLWFHREGPALPKGPWLVAGLQKELIRWSDRKVAERIVKQPGVPLPSVEELNAKIPQSECEENPFGEPRGPWQLQFTVFLVNPDDGSRIISSNSTFGQRADYEDLKSRIKFMRSFRGPNVVPIVQLSSMQMRTRYGVKLRPHFEIIEWRDFGGSPASAIAPAPVEALPGKPVTKPTAGEIIDDSIPF